MRATILAGLVLAALTISTSSADASGALTTNLPSDGNITLVEGGCGPGGFRAANGYCYPRRPPPYYRRACPPGFHLSPYGRCRPNY